MATVQKIYNSEIDFNFNSSVIEFDSGLKLKLKDNPDQEFVQDFSSSAGFSFDVLKTEFAAGIMQQKDQRPVDSAFGVTFTDNVDANWGNGVLTGSLNNGAELLSGKLACLGGTNKYAQWSAADNARFLQQGCVRFKYTPNYSGTPAGTRHLFSIFSSSLANNISMNHNASRQLFLAVYNSAGVAIITTILGTWNQVAGQEYEFELNYDITTGETRVFVDGVQIGATQTQTGVRDTNINYIRFGSNYNATAVSDGSFNDIEIFSTPQHTSNYAPGYVVPENAFAADAITLPQMTYSGAGSIQAFTELAIVDSNSPKFVIQIDNSGVYLYWTGSEWTASTGAIESNTAVDFIAHIDELILIDVNSLQIKIYFVAGNSQQSVDNFILTYTGQIYPITVQSFLTTPVLSTNELQSVVFDKVIVGLDTLTWTIIKNDISLYWNGTAWVASNESFAQRNTAEDISLHLLTLNDLHENEFKLKGFFVSNSGTTTPTLTSIILNYSDGAVCIVTINGKQLDQEGLPSQNNIVVELNKIGIEYLIKNQIVAKRQTIVPAVDGTWSVNLIDTDNMDVSPKPYYIFQFTSNDYISKVNKYVPETIEEIEFNELPNVE